MRALSSLCVLAWLVPALSLAQQQETPPPLVPAPSASPTPAPPARNEAPTPPPPGSSPPPAGAQPQSPTGYPYSPYGQPLVPLEQPPPEIGLMISESAFGILTAAGTVLLPYYLLFKLGNGGLFGTADQTVVDLIRILLIATAPLAVAQTELNQANGSRYYYSESWPAQLAGLGAAGLALGIFYLMPRGYAVDDPRDTVLLVGVVAAMPLVQMGVINLTKTPRHKLPGGGFGALLNASPKGGLKVAVPAALPLVGTTRQGVAVGVHLPVMAARF